MSKKPVNETRSAAAKAAHAKRTAEEKSAAGRKAVAQRWADRTAPPANAAEIIERAAASGCTRTVIAQALGVGKGKLREWLESPEHGPAVQAAMVLARKPNMIALSGSS